ncbi:ABC transporter substrate-binding protein [Bifidobacterium sp. UBA4282]|uniref:ABC transporter substrate-binding protein n=1 Tax=Bifidobacterium sp. UBA4282 TaxID=1946096 RepID=UPI0025B9B1E9|nr:sugar ABC transporter substrate-binding protein [Bifidobacterium sp. UBA4282]
MTLRRNLKVALAAVAAVAVALPLAACGSADSGKTTISFLSWDNEQIMQPFIDKFEEENPDIAIDFSYSPPTPEYIQTLQTRLVGNQAPDVFIITSENKADLMDNDYVLDLTNEPFMENISQANKDFVSRDGKVYGMSLTSWASGIVYNKDLLAEVGVEEPPATWDEFLDLCQDLKDAGITPYLETIADGLSRIPDAFLGSQFAQEGVDVTTLVDEDPQTPGADEKEAVEAWMELYERDLVTRDTVGISGDDMKTQFANGQVAMICTGPWDFSTFQDADMNWGYAPMPILEEGMESYAQGSPSPAFAIYSKLEGEKLDAAKKFLEFMASDWALDQQTANGNAVTVEGYESEVTEQYTTVYQQNVQPGTYFLSTNFYSNPDVLITAQQAESQRLVQGEITVDEWADNIDAKMAAAQ